MTSSNAPHAIEPKEWEEIAQIEDFIDGWGLEPGELMSEFLSNLYGVRFDFVSGSPGYVGPLYLIHGNGAPETAPLALIRGSNGALKVA